MARNFWCGKCGRILGTNPGDACQIFADFLMLDLCNGDYACQPIAVLAVLEKLLLNSFKHLRVHVCSTKKDILGTPAFVPADQ
jgi:hypothetical protein